MTPHRIDDLSRRLAAGLTRRRALAGLLGVAAVAAAGDDALAAPRRTCRATFSSCTRSAQCCTGFCATSGPRRLRHRCACEDQALTACPTGCVDLEFDNDNCGACGNVCGANQGCGYGHCITACDIAPDDTGCFTRPDNSTVSVCITEGIFFGNWADPTCRTDSDCVPLSDTQFEEPRCAVGFRFDASIPLGQRDEQFYPMPAIDNDLLDAGKGICVLAALSGTCKQ